MKNRGLRKDWTSVRFGHLVALSDTGKSKNRSAIWLFRCDCGREREIPINYVHDQVQSGYEPRCSGCRQDDFDITGDVYGSLTALHQISKTDDNRAGSLWEFQCTCGEIVRRLARDVRKQARDGYRPSCGKAGCSNGRKHNSRYADGEAARNELIRSYQKGAKKRGHVFTLTIEEMEQLFQGDCYYCGRPPEQVRKMHHRSHSGAYIYNGIDRVDNNLGYVPGNVVSCCRHCNRAKHQLSHDEFMELVFRIARRHVGTHAK